MVDFTGNNADNVLIGTDGDDRLFGLGGNDLLDGRFGFDYMDGGAGNDTTTYDFYYGSINANLQTGAVSFPGGGPGADTLVNIENVIGSHGDDVIIGDGFDNYLSGGEGNDILDGSFGFDTLDGGAGDDTATYDFYSRGINADLRTGQVSFPGNGSDRFDTLINIENVIGSHGDDIIIGDGFDNYLSGGDGNDILDGSYGFDTLDGGAGNDTTTYDFYAGGINANLQNGVVSFPGSGSDRTDTLANIENVIGSHGDDVIVGDGFDNSLSGGDGNDILDGSYGFDTLDGGAGNDTTTYAFYAGGINADLGTGKVFFPGSGTDLTDTLISIENVIGSQGDDTIIGNALDNTLSGGVGNDILNGKGGNDKLIGGAGNDIYIVNDAGDQVTELGNEGTDLVGSSVTYTLSNQVEHLKLTGTSNINGTGNTLDNTLAGNAGVNTLDGAAGNDTLIGLGGKDVLKGGTGADKFVFTAATDGGDRITDFSKQAGDKIVLLTTGFNGLTAGVLNSNQFVLGSQAKDSNDRIIYNQSKGTLSYDADGKGGVAQVLLATFDNKPGLRATDFLAVATSPVPTLPAGVF
ncbi:MAG TPA: calcium-binding protein [Crinalium sp.]